MGRKALPGLFRPPFQGFPGGFPGRQGKKGLQVHCREPKTWAEGLESFFVGARLKLFRITDLADPGPEMTLRAHRELALRTPKVALSFVPLTLLVTLTTDMLRQFPLACGGAILLFLATGLLRLRLARRFDALDPAHHAVWVRRFSLLVLTTALVYGLALPLILLYQGADWTFLIFLLAITGAAAGATGSLSPHLGLFRAFTALLLLPVMVALLAGGSLREAGLGVIVLFFGVQILLLGQHFHANLWADMGNEHLLQVRAAALEKAHAQVNAANEAKTEFLANMSHEMRTPLNGILGLTDLVLETDLQPQQEEYLKDVRASGQALLRVINEVLDYSRLETGKMELAPTVFSLPELLGRVAVAGELGGRPRGNTLIMRTGEGFPQQVVGDAPRIHQILTNLVDNAVKFTKLGKVAIDAQLESRQDGLVCFTIKVQDTGPGIAPAIQAQIFQAFRQADGSTTRAVGGTGLGLAVSSSLAALMGGHISLQSVLGQGSTFTLHLTLPEPRPLEPEAPPAPARDAAAEALSGLTVLMAEDNTVNAKLATRVLEKAGLAVLWAHNGHEAVARHAKGGVDLVLMDIQMPELDGFGATAAIRQAEAPTGKRVPIIALTAHAVDGYREKCLAADMDDFLTKPLQPKALRDTLTRWSPRTVSPAGE